ncbi:MAG: hypothetical protein AAGG68_23555 [Bacteroidota bacterium]
MSESIFFFSLDLKTIIIIVLTAFIFGMLTMSQNNWRGTVIERPNFGLNFNLLFLGAILLIFLYLMRKGSLDEIETPPPNSRAYISKPIHGSIMNRSYKDNYLLDEITVKDIEAAVIEREEINQRGSPSNKRVGQGYVIQVAAVREENSVSNFLERYSNHPLEVVNDYDGKTRIWIVGFNSKFAAETYRKAHQIKGFSRRPI